MVAVCEVLAEQLFSEYFGACQPPATEWNMTGPHVFVPLPRRECQKYVVGNFADDDHLTIAPNKSAQLYCCPSCVQRSTNMT